MTYTEFKGKRVLVTGANGYLGSWMTELLAAENAECIAMTGPGNKRNRLEKIERRVRQISVDLRLATGNTLEREIGQVDHIFHMAAVGVNQKADNIGDVADVNIRGAMTVLRYAQATGARSVVVTGSGFEYPPGLMIDERTLPDPASFYALTKAAASMSALGFAASSGMHISVLRPFVVYGPREAGHRLVTQVCRAVVEGRPVDITSGTQTRDWVYVMDAIDAHLRAAVMPEASGKVINVASGVPVSVRAVAEQIVRLGGGDPGLLNFGAMATRPHEIMEQTGDPALASRVLGWTATTTLTDGLRKTLAWHGTDG